MLGYHIAFNRSALQSQLAKAKQARKAAQARYWLEVHDHRIYCTLLIAIVHSKVKHTCAFCSFGEIIFLVSGNSTYFKSLRVDRPLAAISVNHRINLFLILAQYGNVLNAFADKCLIADLRDTHLALSIESNDVINTRTLLNWIILLQAPASKAVFPIHVKCFSGSHNLHPVNDTKLSNFCPAFAAFAIFFNQVFKVGNCIASKITKVFLHLHDLLL